MERRALVMVWCLVYAVGALAEEGTGLENKRNGAQYPIECTDDSRAPEHVVNCELLIAGLKHDSSVTRQELCCTLLSSQATKSMCCHQVRDLCESQAHNVNHCPKNRRRIKPPRLTVDGRRNKKTSDHSGQTTTETAASAVLLPKVKKVTVPL